MVGITLSPEQIRMAPPEVRRWLEHELAVSLGLRSSDLQHDESDILPLASCTVEEVARVLSAIQSMLPVVGVFFELGREGAAITRGGMEAFRLADILRHTRLNTLDQVLACLNTINDVAQRIRGDGSLFSIVDRRGYCFVAVETQRSILRLWHQVVGQRDLGQSAEAPAEAATIPGQTYARPGPMTAPFTMSPVVPSPQMEDSPIHPGSLAPAGTADATSATIPFVA